MIRELKIGDLKCVCIPHADTSKIVYMIYPEIVAFQNEWLQQMSEKYKFPLAVIYIPPSGWNDMLTPWPESGETPDSPPFAGHASRTLEIIKDQVIPEVEKTLGIQKEVQRNLLGVSLSGLFTLWQWFNCSLFHSIACLSGSFWYNGFMDWFNGLNIPQKSGTAYFLLGKKEPKAWIKAYRSVGNNTEKVVEKLKSSGINVTFQWVPGDHFADPLERAELGLSHL